MTRQRKAVSSPSGDGNHAILAPLAPARNRTEEVVQRLQTEISSGRLAAGARLPTEHDMMQAMGVSRTVVREAVAALKAEGLVRARQGSGVFVAIDVGRRGFRIEADDLRSIPQILQVLELRLAIEIESAALASQRASARALKAMRTSLDAFLTAIDRGENAVPEDFAFHRAIVEATGNPHFVRLLEFLGHFIIPRQTIRAERLQGTDWSQYLRRIHREHEAICAAITARDVDAARAAMRAHLEGAMTRYRSAADAHGRSG